MDIPYVFLDGYCASPMGYHSTALNLWLIPQGRADYGGMVPEMVNVYIAVENHHAISV
jgi:hypothetical protein